MLFRSKYPDLWDGSGYPEVPSAAALFGDVVHDSLEAIVRALAKGGCTSAIGPEAIAVLKELGGYTAVAKCLVPGLMEALIPRKDESHGSTEEVPGGASGAGDQDGSRSAA